MTSLYIMSIITTKFHEILFSSFRSIAHKLSSKYFEFSRMVDFCESYSPFHVCLTIRPSAHLVYATSHLSFVAFYSYLVS
jgi:hypothetical protein